MSKEFKTWREARDYAEQQAREVGVAYGIEKPTPYAGWTVKMLPRPENRSGWELRCEAVEPSDTTRNPEAGIEIPGNLEGADFIISMPSEDLADPSPALPNPPRRRATLEHPALDLYAGHDGFLVRTALIRSEKYSDVKRPKIANSEDAASLCSHLRYADQEHLVVLALDGQMKLRAIHEAAIGSSSSTSQTMNHLVKVATLTSSSAVIMVHNHPSGDPRPSPEDIAMTKQVKSGLECLGIVLMDHVIVAEEGATSMADMGTL